jgi:calmodulin
MWVPETPVGPWNSLVPHRGPLLVEQLHASLLPATAHDPSEPLSHPKSGFWLTVSPANTAVAAAATTAARKAHAIIIYFFPVSPDSLSGLSPATRSKHERGPFAAHVLANLPLRHSRRAKKEGRPPKNSKIQILTKKLLLFLVLVVEGLVKMAARLDEESKEEFTAAFQQFSKGKGRCSPPELASLMRYMGTIYTDAELLESIREAGGNEQTGVDQNQFLEIMGKKSASDSTQDELKLAFQVFDKDASGTGMYPSPLFVAVLSFLPPAHPLSPTVACFRGFFVGGFAWLFVSSCGVVFLTPPVDVVATSELRYVLTAVGDKLDDEQVEEMLKMSDPSGTGALQYEPFIREMLSKPT